MKKKEVELDFARLRIEEDGIIHIRFKLMVMIYYFAMLMEIYLILKSNYLIRIMI